MNEDQRETVQQAVALLDRFEFSSSDGWVLRYPEESEVQQVQAQLKTLLDGKVQTVAELVQEIRTNRESLGKLRQEEAMTSDKARYAVLSGRDGLVNQAERALYNSKNALRRRVEQLAGVPFHQLQDIFF